MGHTGPVTGSLYFFLVVVEVVVIILLTVLERVISVDLVFVIAAAVVSVSFLTTSTCTLF